MKATFKKTGFSLTEMIVTFAIITLIAIIVMPGILYEDPNRDSLATMSKKTAEYLEQASLEILIYNSIYDDFTRMKFEDTYFSIEDDIAKEKMPALFQKYMNDVDIRVNLSKNYFDRPIVNYDKTKLPVSLRNIYSNYFWVLDGVLIGFRIYDDCNTTEIYANPPEHKGVYEVANSCGSIFYDVNGFKKPNKIGNDQYILPIYKRGIKYSNE